MKNKKHVILCEDSATSASLCWKISAQRHKEHDIESKIKNK